MALEPDHAILNHCQFREYSAFRDGVDRLGSSFGQ